MLSTFLLVAILILLGFIYLKLDAIYSKLTERDRAREKRTSDIIRKSDLQRAAWDRLSEADKARFNDFHYEHVIGEISDEEYEKMKRELNEKTDGIGIP